MTWLLDSKGMNNCKSILTICRNDWSTFWLIYCCHVYFFSARFLNMCNPRTTFYLLWRTGPPELAFYGSGLACLISWLEMVNAGWLDSMRSEIFFEINFIIFQGCPSKHAVFLPWQPAPYNQLLIQPLLLVPECYFAQNVETSVLKLWSHFSQNAVSIGCNIFCLVLVIYLIYICIFNCLMSF